MTELAATLDPAAQALEHEQSLLGSVLFGYLDIPGLTRLVSREDFYRPQHMEIWDAALRVHSSGTPVTPLLVADELGGDLERVGGLPYLHTLLRWSSAASADYAAQEVRDASLLRTVSNHGHRLLQLPGSGREPQEIVAEIRNWCDEALSTKASLSTVGSVLESVIDIAQHGEPRAMPTPWHSLGELIDGWFPGDLVTIGARPGVGKALALDTPLPSPSGWTQMGDVRVGDWLFDAEGRPTRVLAATDYLINRPCFRVEFDDGSSIIADSEHQWLTSTRASRRAATPPGGYLFNRVSLYSRDQRGQSEKPAVRTTAQIASTLRTGPDSRLNHAVKLTQPLELPEADLALDPYVLGVWLGDGSSRSAMITTADPEVVAEIIAAGYPCRKLNALMSYSLSDTGRGHGASTFRSQLVALDLLQNKHIPLKYLRASRRQRLSLLQGLMDTDGTIGTSRRCSFDVTSEVLARGVFELVASLGIKATFTTRPVKGRSADSSTCYRVGFVTDQPVFRLPRKLARIPLTVRPTVRQRMIVAVVPVASVPVRCIQVDNGDHLYLAGRACIPTHNSVFLENAAHHAATHGRHVLFVSLEMRKTQVAQRTMAHAAGVPLQRLRNGSCTDRDWERITKASPQLEDLPWTIADQPGQTVEDIRANAWEARRKARQDGAELSLILVDYLGRIKPMPGPSSESRQQAVGKMTWALKTLALEFEVPVLLAAQLNRDVTKSNRRPDLPDLREAGDIEQDSDAVIFLHKPEDGSDEREFVVAKQRNGPTGVRSCYLSGHYCRLHEEAA